MIVKQKEIMNGMKNQANASLENMKNSAIVQKRDVDGENYMKKAFLIILLIILVENQNYQEEEEQEKPIIDIEFIL